MHIIKSPNLSGNWVEFVKEELLRVFKLFVVWTFSLQACCYRDVSLYYSPEFVRSKMTYFLLLLIWTKKLPVACWHINNAFNFPNTFFILWNECLCLWFSSIQLYCLWRFFFFSRQKCGDFGQGMRVDISGAEKLSCIGSLLHICMCLEDVAWGKKIRCEAYESFVSVCFRHMLYRDSTRFHNQM